MKKTYLFFISISIFISLLDMGGVRRTMVVSVLDCWSTGRAIDLAPRAGFITIFISFAQVFPGPVQNRGLKHHSFILSYLI